jgi:hypothetical protein
LELPGQSNAGACTVTIDRIGLDGKRHRVWSGTSRAGASAGYTALTIDGGFLLPGDYVLQAADTNRQIWETYSIRVTAGPHP